jgi:hypothetical protein
MVAILDTAAPLKSALNYNEKKVQQGDAELILAGNFLKDKDDMTFYEKAERFERLNELNTRSQANTLHAKVSFDPSENLSNERMAEIAEKYMEGLGMKDQPYLVYRHTDTGTPHMHIVATLIKPDGKRIETNNMGRNQSRKTADQIEKDFGLVKAKDHKQDKEYDLKPIDVQKILKGEKKVKQSMQNILKKVLDEYKFTSLPELNAILREYNMTADRGSPDTTTYKTGGLLYKVLNDQGHVEIKPIKASLFYFKPTLKNLEEQFKKHKANRKEELGKLRKRLDWILMQKPKDLADFVAKAEKENIQVVVYRNDKGVIYGTTYVDNENKVAVTGQDLGKAYSIKSILETLGHQGTILKPTNAPTVSKDQNTSRSPVPHAPGKPKAPAREKHREKRQAPHFNPKSPHLLKDLLAHEESGGLPQELKKDRRKKKRRRHL